MKNLKNFPQFTHFLSIPFIRQQHRNTLGAIQDKIYQIFKQHNLQKYLRRSNTNLMHMTLSMLTLNIEQSRIKSKKVLQNLSIQLKNILSQEFVVKLKDIKFFTRYNKKDKTQYVSLFYFDFQMDQNMLKVQKITDLLIKELIKEEIIHMDQLKSMRLLYDHKQGKFRNQKIQQGLQKNQDFKELFKKVQYLVNNQKQIEINQIIKNNVKLEFDFIDISTRFNYDQTKFYAPLARVILKEENKIEK